MKRLSLLIILAAVLVYGPLRAGGLFPGTMGESAADKITYDNSTSGLTATNVNSAIDEVKALVELENTSGIADIDDLPGDTTDDDLIDSALLDADLTTWAGITAAANMGTFLATPSSANLAATVTDETGSGLLVFATSPTLVTPILGTPQSGNFSTGSFSWPTFNQNTTGTAANLSGTPPLPNGTTATTQSAGDNSTKLATTAYADALVDNTAYDASTWDGVEGKAPSKNAIRDYLETKIPAGADGTYGILLGNNTSTWTPGAGTYGYGFVAGVPTVDINNSLYSIPKAPSAGPMTFTGPSAARSYAIRDAADTIATVGADLTWTGSNDFGGAGLEIPNGNADASLATAGKIYLNTTDEQLSVHSANDGEISGEVSLSLIQHKTWSFDPKAVCDGAVDRLFLMTIGDDAPEGIIIDEWKVSFEADPTTEADLDLKYADAFIGVANAAVIDVLDTTAGAASEDTDSNINSGNAVANGKVLYLEFGTAYTETTHQIIFELWYHAEEDAAPAAGGSGTWVYSNSHTPTSGDSTTEITNTVHVGDYITAPVGATKITKLRWAVSDGASARNVRICVYPQYSVNSIGGGTGSTPGTSSGFMFVDTGTLDISITAGSTYFVLASPSGNLDGYYSATDGLYDFDSYSESACVDDVVIVENEGRGHCVGAYFE